MPTRKRVLFLADHLGYSGGVSHGVTTYCRAVFPALAADDVELKCAFLGAPHVAGAVLQDAGISTVFVDSSKYGLGSVPALVRLLDDYQPSLVHVTQQKSTTLARLLQPVFGYKVLAHVHDFDPIPSFLRHLSKVLPQPDRTLCVAAAVVPTAVTQYCIAAESCAVLPNGLDLTRFSEADSDGGLKLRREIGIPPNAPVVGMAVRIFADKRVDRFVADLAMVLQRCPTAHAIIGGDGPELERCRRLAAELNLSARVHFLGHQKDVRPVILACDVMALYSLLEACPFAAIEPLALGKPVVGFDSGGMKEIVSSTRAGFLASASDHGELTEQLSALLQNRTRCQSMAEDCKAVAAKFSLGRHTAALLQCYRDLSKGERPQFDANSAREAHR